MVLLNLAVTLCIFNILFTWHSGLHKGVAKHISDEKGRKFLKVVIEYRRAFANTLIARCRLMSMQESQIQVSDMSAKFKLDSSDKTHVKEVIVLNPLMYLYIVMRCLFK
jgi:hypothetical protein